MTGLLVRVGVDQAFGGWNAPVDPTTGKFCYVPIPEGAGRQRTDLATSYRDLVLALAEWPEVSLPSALLDSATHLDPDFRHLTYGDNGSRRGRDVAELVHGDFLAFYAGLRAAQPRGRLVYALIGFLEVNEVVRAVDVPEQRWSENAHTRRAPISGDDVIVRGAPGRSGRLDSAIPIGTFRDRAYRVRPELLDAWGGLSCNDGYIQRSAVPPSFLEPRAFLDWLRDQRPVLVAKNNPPRTPAGGDNGR